ncbi:MAG: M56 family metallopeptidase, partial [Planctomycetes bacterium]|nr:M56 family metallopeptidase [Planctomycetota bacterium]
MFTWLCFNTLCALPLALAALLVRRLPRVTPAVEHLLWLLVLVRLVLPPLSFDLATPVASSSSAAIVSSAAPGLGDVLVARATRLLGTNWSTWASRGLLALFLATLAWVVLRELLRVRAVERCVRRSGGGRGRLEAHVRAVAAGLGVSAPPVRVLPEASGPFLWNLGRPILVLPAAEPLPAPTVLAHELAHLRRRDHWTAWLELLVQALHFWNPLFWFARRQLHRAAELACDQWVVARFPAERR